MTPQHLGVGVLLLAFGLFFLGGLLFARFRGDAEMGVGDTRGREEEEDTDRTDFHGADKPQRTKT